MSVPLFSPEGVLFAEFDRAEDARGALLELRSRGYARVDTYSPFPLASGRAAQRESWLGLAVVVFAVAALGGGAGYLTQWYTNAYSYPLNIGGRPTHAVPAFVYPTLEAVILLAGLTVFVGLLVALRLPRLWRPEFELDEFDRASDDRFWLAVRLGSGGGDLDRTSHELKSLRAKRVIHAVPEP